MRLARSCVRAAGMVLVMALVGGAPVRGNAVVTVTTTIDDNAAPPAVTLSPDLEAKLKTFIDNAKEQKQKMWEARMTKEVDHIVQVTGMDANQAKTLDEPAKQAVAKCLDPWAAKATDLFRTSLTQVQSAQVAQILAENPALIAQSAWGIEAPNPYEQDDWIKAVHQALTPDQAAKWDKEESDRKAQMDKEISISLDRGVDRVSVMQKQDITSASHGIEVALNLPKDRADKLEALGNDVADQAKDKWKKRFAGMLRDMGDDQRRMFASNPNIFIGLQADEYPSQLPAWKQGLASFLTPDEANRLKGAEDARKVKREHVMSQVMLTLLDDKIALTTDQRAKLVPLTDRLIKDVPNLFPNAAMAMGGYFAIQPQMLYNAAAKATDADLKPVLDDLQLKRWHELANPDDSQANGADGGKTKPDDAVEPEDVEKAISAYLFQKTEEQRKKSINESVLKAEDVARTAKVGTDAACRLEAAARGTAEESLAMWKWQVEQQIRGQLQGDLTPQNIKQRLAGIQDFIFQQNFVMMRMNQGGPRLDYWDATVKSALTPQQQDLWKKETDARDAFRGQAVAALVLEEFDRKYELTDDQWQKLSPIIAGIVHDDSADISQMFGNGNETPWFLNSQFTLMPFVGMSDTDLKSILTKDQLTQWTGSPDYANATSWWTNIKQIHQQRQQQLQMIRAQIAR
jgi:hypothetical protein